ncbi:hypothetical protein RHS03_05805, partial [Rhizoctonia solani]
MSLSKAMTEWERIDAQLECVLGSYLNACQALESLSTTHPPGIPPAGIASSLLKRLENFQTCHIQRLSYSRFSLIRARNKLLGTACNLPEEILAEIFWLAVKDADSHDQFLGNLGRARYKCLHRLLAVCTVWRRAGLSYGKFWSLIPLMNTRSAGQAIEYTLVRSQESRLHLAGVVGNTTASMFIRHGIDSNGPRFRSVNLYTERLAPRSQSMRNAVAAFLKCNRPGRLEELSLCHRPVLPLSFRTSEYLFPRLSVEDEMLSRFADSLSVLRIAGLNLHWSNLTLTGLVELRIQHIALEEASLTDFLVTIASAPKLRNLCIIRVVAVHNPPTISRLDRPNLPISLPMLGYLYLQDLYKDTLEFLLRSIGDGNYRTVLSYASRKYFYINTPNGEIYTGPETLDLHDLGVDALMLNDNPIHSDNFRPLLRTMPTLKELYINDSHLTNKTLKALTRLPDDHTDDNAFRFPKLQKLYLTSCSIDNIADSTAFRDMVASHEIQELGLSVLFTTPSTSDKRDNAPRTYGFEDPRAAPIQSWLQSIVPRFRPSVCAEELSEPDFRSDEWRLW